MGFGSTAALESAITNGTITVWVASGPGLIAGSNGQNSNAQDLFCGDSNDNTISIMDSGVGTRDYFFGGAGNDSVTGTTWYSTIYGGPGNDYVDDLEEASIFYGGPGTDSYRIISTGSWASTFDQGADIVELSSFALTGNAQSATYRVPVTVSVVVTVASKVTFFSNGKRIAGCINRLTTGSGSTNTATCNWRPAIIVPSTLKALATPIASGTAATFTMAPVITIFARSGTR
jgi:Ca2+-binding RTX toxin-like protein